MSQLHLPRMPQLEAWDTITHSHFTVSQMFLFYVLPLSLVPPGMIYFADVAYGGTILPMLSDMQLLTVGTAFFLTEVAMTFLVAYIIRRLGEVVELNIAFADAYKLAVVVATPLWLVSLCLFAPSVVFDISAGSVALILSGILIYYNVPDILKVEEGGQSMMLSSVILVTGMVAWAAMMLLTFLSWAYVTSSLFS